MASNQNKTTATDTDVQAFIASITDERRRGDAQTLVELMQEATGQPPVMWGTSIVGFGSVHYRYATGREGDTVAVGFSPRKAQSTLYLTGALTDYDDLLARLGPYEAGKGCLHLKQVDRVDRGALREVIDRSYRKATEAEPSLGS